MKRDRKACGVRLSGVVLAAAMSVPGVAKGVVVLSDSFSRSPAGVPVGTPPTRDSTPASVANAEQNWISSWSANNNAMGGYITQTYATYVEPSGRKFKQEGVGLSGNWLNNGSSAHPLRIAGTTNFTQEPIGIMGFAWVQVNHDFASNATVVGSGHLRISFDWYRTTGGNISWYFGNDDVTGANNGTAGSPVLNPANDVGLLWRGTQANSYGVFNNGAVRPNPPPGIPTQDYNQVPYAAGTVLGPSPIPVVLDIFHTNLTSGAFLSAGSTSRLEMKVGGVVQDLNGFEDGVGINFTWGGGAKFMGFGSNQTPVAGTVTEPIFLASGIDNLVITAVGGQLPLILGDFNFDGGLDGSDVDPFVLALSDLDAYLADFASAFAEAYPGSTLDSSVVDIIGDFNEDGGFDGSDVDGFVAALSGGRPGASVIPEPAGLAALVPAGLLLSRRRR